MVEETRAHGRIEPRPLSTRRVALSGILARPVELHLPPTLSLERPLSLHVHFLGPDYIAVAAGLAADSGMAVAVVNLSPGTAAYELPFRGTNAWARLLSEVTAAASAAAGGPVVLGSVYLSAFSAGNGAVRAILADSGRAQGVRGVLILDGIHTGYIPPRRVAAEGGVLDSTNLQVHVAYAQRAMRGEVRFVVTHSEVFPGTFASTTETANWLVRVLGLRRTPVIAWGPNGMQQTSEVRAGRFEVLGFAGNSAPDHLDHLHALPAWLSRIVRP